MVHVGCFVIKDLGVVVGPQNLKKNKIGLRQPNLYVVMGSKNCN